MKVALNLEAAGWLGGRYYLENLALALLEHTSGVELVTVGPPGTGPEGIPHTERTPDDADVVFPNWNLREPTAAAQMHWIPDLQHRALPQYFGRLARLRRDRGYRRLARRASVVVVSSEVARADAARAYPSIAPKLRVLHFTSAAPPSPRASPETLQRYGLPERFVLLPNQFWAHKNHATAFAAAPQLSVPLVCTGAVEDHRRPDHVARLLVDLEQSDSSARVHILGVVPRDDYLSFVSTAAAVLQPSLFEGWSSVVEDARAYGRPIALSDIPVHREQNPPLSYYFEPLDAQALAGAVAAAAASEPLPAADAAAAQTDAVRAFALGFIELAEEAAATRHLGKAQ
jgi:glycosyltransferase involved in cell wall biosynthesis